MSDIDDILNEVTKKVQGEEPGEQQVQPSRFYIMDDDLDTVGVKHIENIKAQIRFHHDHFFRMYFDPDNTQSPYLDIFLDSDEEQTLQYCFLEDVDDVEKVKKFMDHICTRKFLNSAHDRFGDFQVKWEGPEEPTPITRNYFGIYFTLKLSDRKTYLEAVEDYQFLRQAYAASQEGESERKE